MRRQLHQLVNLRFGGMGSLQDALEHGEARLFVGPFESQAKRGAADHGRIEDVGAVGDHDERDRRGAGRELVDLLDEHVDAGAILMMRLHLAAAGREIVRLVDDEDAAPHGGGARLCLGKGFGDARRKLADMPAATNIGGCFKADDALIDGAGHRCRDAGRQGGLAAAHVAGKKNQRKR